MPEDIRLEVTDESVISCLNTPGGAVFEWRDKTAEAILQKAVEISPSNHPDNARHRGSVVGTYRVSFAWDRVGSNGHRVRGTIVNVSDHAQIVEYGRMASFRPQRFSWTEANKQVRRRGRWITVPAPGHIKWYSMTWDRDGDHILGRATNTVMRIQTNGQFTPVKFFRG